MSNKKAKYTVYDSLIHVNKINDRSSTYTSLSSYMTELDEILEEYLENILMFCNSTSQKGEFIEAMKIYRNYMKDSIKGQYANYSQVVETKELAYRTNMNEIWKKYI